MHIKRQAVEKSWPVTRKGTKFLVRASHNRKKGVPVLIILRDMMKIAKNRKEVKKILQEGKVLVNNKKIKDDKFSVSPFDLIKIGDKNYELRFSETGKFDLKETSRKENIYKIIGRKILKNKKIQLNLFFGKNILIDKNTKANIGNSLVLGGNKIKKILPIEKNRNIFVFEGKHRGKEGKIENIDSVKKIAEISYEKEKINVPLKNILVIN